MISVECIDSGLVIPEVLHLFGTSMLMRLRRRSISLMVGSEWEKSPKNIIVISSVFVCNTAFRDKSGDGLFILWFVFCQDELLMAER